MVPRELRDDELPDIVAGFVRAAENARAAGFDGVVWRQHLLDEFCATAAPARRSLRRTARENCARLLFEVLDAVCKGGGGRVGVRLSPLNSYNNDMIDSDPIGFGKLARRLP